MMTILGQARHSADAEDCLRDAHCCSCFVPMMNSQYVNVVQVDRFITWKYPAWGNVYIEGSTRRAVAVLCDRCIEQQFMPTHALEWVMEEQKWLYHEVETLEIAPPIELAKGGEIP
jgi:hypothetical protein